MFKGAEKTKKSTIVIITVGISMIVSFFLDNLNDFFEDTKYGFYSDSGGSLIGNWYVVAGVMIALYVLYAYKNIDEKNYFNMLVVLCNVPILIIVLGAHAYRLVYYYALPRITMWSYALQRGFGSGYDKTDKKAKLFVNFLMFIMVIVYMLFRFSRYSAERGFEYSLIFF